MWDQLRKMMLGSKVGNQMKVANCINNYEEFKAKANEILEDTYERFVLLLNEISKKKVTKKQIENNVKFLSVLQPEWKKQTRRMKQMKDLSEIPLHEVYETLRQNEEEVEEKRALKKKSEKVPDPIALVGGEKEKEKKEKKKKKKIVISSSESDFESDGSNSQRYSSTGSKNHEHRERVEGRFVEKRPDEKKKYVNDYTSTEKKVDDLIKCYNCGKVGHYPKDCRKPKVQNSEYCKNKMLLAKQEEVGKALMVEDKYWLDHSNVEEEKEEEAHMCLMGSIVKDDDSEDETSDEVENKTLEQKVNGLEAKLYIRGQTDQTIFLNTPNEEVDFKEKWGLGYDNPHYLEKAVRKQPTLYNANFMYAAEKYTHLKPKFITKSSKEVEAKEDEKRMNLKKMQLPFCYERLNDSESSTKVGESVSENADYYAKGKKHKKQRSQKRNNTDIRKKRSEARTEWRPKRKSDDKTRHMWYLDSGCSKHITRQNDLLTNYKEKFCGNVSYVKGLGHNLFSISQFYDKGLEVNFKAKSCSLCTKDGKELLVGTGKSNLYTINLSKVQTDNQFSIRVVAYGSLWSDANAKLRRKEICSSYRG
ncbi:hypothetical protein L6452_30940 [Arctium lappa]|uniref:Uncharacterized protein n=1 Tax=Arctium lappa TaxID=4217 RepID=A0ACB8ZJW9_ARCLA|nr:hypothetical protein L6452_30940 [Arctium lappa]